MKKVLRYLLIVLGILVILVGGFAAFIAFRGIPKYTAENFNLQVASTPERVERGRQLSSMLCNDCHMSPNTHKLTGRKMDEISQFGSVYSRNITKDPEHGIGKMTDGQLYYLLRTGVRPDGRFLPIMAKLQKMSDEKTEATKAEVHRLLEAKFIEPIANPTSLANVVMVQKKNGKWRMCIDFTNLNKAYPKDNFPLLRIEKIVDSAAGCEVLSLLDCFSGYNQIYMKEEDKAKTSFITPVGE